MKNYIPEYKENHPKDLMDKVIKPYAEIWDFVRDATFEATEWADTINDYLYWLNRIDFKDWVPPALLYCRLFWQQPKQLVDFFARLERLTYFLAVKKSTTNERIKVYADLMQKIEAKDFNGNLAALLGTLELTPEQKWEFRTILLQGQIYSDLPKVRLTLILRIEALLSDNSKKQQFSNCSLEHVLPQSLQEDSEWRKWFQIEDKIHRWRHTIANLVLLDKRKNSQASNSSFAVKKDTYFFVTVRHRPSS